MNELQVVSNIKEEIGWSKAVIGENVDLTKVKKEGRHIRVEVYNVSEETEKWIAEIKLESMGIEIDELTPEQVDYLSRWDIGT